jgi:hypothetical protein
MTVNIEGLGKCEHCGTLITIEGFPSEAMDAEWHCPSCNKILTHKSFGYENEQGHKIRWVGPNGEWTEKKPTKNFRLGKWEVTIPNRTFIY